MERLSPTSPAEKMMCLRAYNSGLVERELQVRKRGRPAYLYYLSGEGEVGGLVGCLRAVKMINSLDSLASQADGKIVLGLPFSNCLYGYLKRFPFEAFAGYPWKLGFPLRQISEEQLRRAVEREGLLFLSKEDTLLRALQRKASILAYAMLRDDAMLESGGLDLEYILKQAVGSGVCPDLLELVKNTRLNERFPEGTVEVLEHFTHGDVLAFEEREIERQAKEDFRRELNWDEVVEWLA